MKVIRITHHISSKYNYPVEHSIKRDMNSKKVVLEVQTESSSISFGCRGLPGDGRPIATEFFQCTPILILLFDVRVAIRFALLLLLQTKPSNRISCFR